MTLAPVAAEVTPHPEILYQVAAPNEGRNTRIARWLSIVLLVPLSFVLANAVAWPLAGPLSAAQIGALIGLFTLFLALILVCALVGWSLAHPTPPPAVTKDGVLVYRWLRFGNPSPVEHRFQAQQTVKGYRAGQYTVIELHPPHGRRAMVKIIDPDERALKIVREAVLKSGTKMAEDAA